MARVWHVGIDEFSKHVRQFIDRVVRDDDTVVIETEGEALVTLYSGEPGAGVRRQLSNAELQDLMAVAGVWSEVDIDRFLADVYASRQSSRPPVEL